MEKIFIEDNFLNEIELEILYNFVNEKLLKYGHSSGDREIIVNKFFSVENKDCFFLHKILQKIEQRYSKKFKINRHYMHIQNYGQDGGYHIDDDGKNKYTFCIYIHNIKNKKIENIGGEFLINIPNSKKIICIEPFNNRSILFPSQYLHKGMAFVRYYTDYRLCLTWKLELIE